MEIFDWHYHIKLLESTSNLKSAIRASVGRTPSTEIANGIAVCLQQGRMFFESAKNAPIEIRPLLTFYGMIGFAKGLILARNLRKIECLKPSHGIQDISSENSRLHEVELKVLTSGTFQEFNDVVSHTGKITQTDEYNEKYYLGKLCDKSDRLNDLQVSLKDILSRLPDIEDQYNNTFQEGSKVLHFRLENSGNNQIFRFSALISPNFIIDDHESLKQFISELRDSYPFLNNWCFDGAVQHPLGSTFTFINIEKININEFSGDFVTPFDFVTDHNLRSVGGNIRKKPSGKIIQLNSIKFNSNEINKLKLSEIIPPLVNVGSFHEPNLLVVQPIKNFYLSQYSLQYLGMFLLSSLVRYRPQIWVNAISKKSIGNSIVDDTALSLIEKFVDLTLSEFPKMIVDEIKNNPINV